MVSQGRITSDRLSPSNLILDILNEWELKIITFIIIITLTILSYLFYTHFKFSILPFSFNSHRIFIYSN
jgi:hypothetical protein